MARSQKLGQITPTTRDGQVNWPQKERGSIKTPSTGRYPMEREGMRKAKLDRIYMEKETMIGK